MLILHKKEYFMIEAILGLLFGIYLLYKAWGIK